MRSRCCEVEFVIDVQKSQLPFGQWPPTTPLRLCASAPLPLCAPAPLRPTLHPQQNTSNISATTGYFPTQIQRKNHLSTLYRTHRLLSNSMKPFLRSLLPTISRQRRKISQRPRIC